MTAADARATDDVRHMNRALELARRGEGSVEPNPMVGCVVVCNGAMAGEGWHRQFGGPHAEVEALRAANDKAAGATLYVTLEPCCHVGKTPPCTHAIVAAKIARVVVGCQDPNPQVAGQGLAELRAAGIQVENPDLATTTVNLKKLIAPFTKLLTQRRPWIIAKWAMTLDGKLATRTGSSRWISGTASRALVQQIRGRVDAILVGRRTAELDDPLLTARPPGPRTATRIVLDTAATLSPSSKLARTADEAPVILAVGENAPEQRCQQLREQGIEIVALPGRSHAARLEALLEELGRRQMTNVLVEGGGQVLGTLLDLGAIDEVHAFVVPKLAGGESAPTPIAGQGIAHMAEALPLQSVDIDVLDGDIHIHGRT